MQRTDLARAAERAEEEEDRQGLERGWRRAGRRLLPVGMLTILVATTACGEGASPFATAPDDAKPISGAPQQESREATPGELESQEPGSQEPEPQDPEPQEPEPQDPEPQEPEPQDPASPEPEEEKTATDPPPPSYTGSWANRPSGFGTWNDQRWEAVGSNGWQHRNRASQSRVVQDASAPFAPGNVLEHAFPQGFPSGGTEPAIDWINLQGQSEFFVGMWFKASDPWHGHSSQVNKLAFAWSDDHRSSVVLTMHGPPGGPYHLLPLLANHPDSRKGYLPQNVNEVPMRLGQWHRLELHFVTGPGGQGSLRWWQDGVLLGDIQNLSYAPGGFGQFELAPTWGGVGGPNKAQNDYFRYGPVHIGVPPGR